MSEQLTRERHQVSTDQRAEEIVSLMYQKLKELKKRTKELRVERGLPVKE